MELTIKDSLIYVPARDFEVSRRFYSALGFSMTEGWGGTLDCRLGGAAFRLQNYYVKDWAENFMMKFDVAQVQPWYDNIRSALDTATCGDARISQPEMAGDTKILHVIDPSGVLLIFVETE